MTSPTGPQEPDAAPVRVEEVALPGVGRRFDFLTRRGRRIGVLAHRSGRRDLVVYDRDDPDACSETIALTAEEADTMAELLGTPRIVEHLAALHDQVAGLVSEQLTVEPASPYSGRTIADTAARTRTGASIVAVMRGGRVIASPSPDFRFETGDGVVVVGTPDGVEQVARILNG